MQMDMTDLTEPTTSRDCAQSFQRTVAGRRFIGMAEMERYEPCEPPATNDQRRLAEFM